MLRKRLNASRQEPSYSNLCHCICHRRFDRWHIRIWRSLRVLGVYIGMYDILDALKIFIWLIRGRESYHIDKASTETSAFCRYPAKRISAMKYHTSKLHKINLNIYSSFQELDLKLKDVNPTNQSIIVY